MELRFRPYDCGLKESVSEIRRFNSINTFMLFLKAKYHRVLVHNSFNYENVSFIYHLSSDDKIGWKNIFIVSVYGEPCGYITFDDIDIKKYIEFCKTL